MSADRPGAGIYVFAKPPRDGLVKTRLAASIGESAATALAAAFLRDSLRLARSVPWALPALAATEIDAPEYALDGSLRVVSQGEGDLGARMERVAIAGLARHPAVVLVGTDCPGIGVEHFEAARRALVTYDAYLGPTEDGGFYLVALRTCPPGLFGSIPWSTPDTLTATRARFEACGLSVCVGMPWFDLDDARDLASVADRWEAIAREAPETAAILRDVVPFVAPHARSSPDE